MSQQIFSPEIGASKRLKDNYGPIASAQLITCQNTLNVTPVKDAVKQRVEKIKQHDPNANIIIWAGELHSHPVIKLIQPALIDAITETGLSSIYAMEAARNFGINVADNYNFSIPTDLADELIKRDNEGAIHNLMMTYHHHQSLSPKTIEALSLFWIEKNVRTVFTDAARCDSGNFLDSADLETKTAFDKLKYHKVGGSVTPAEEKGIDARNLVMFTQVKSLLSDIDCVVQMCGVAHVFGQTGKFNRQNSLSGLKESDSTPNTYDLKIIPLSKDFNISQIPAGSKTDNTFLVEGLDDRIVHNRHMHEIDLIRSVKGVDKYFAEYDDRTRFESYHDTRKIYDFFQSWAKEEKINGKNRVRALRQAIF